MTQQVVSAPGRQGPAGTLSQFLTFLLGAEQYGVEILKVQEIKGYSAVTPIPNAPRYLKGVMNLRGTVIPVVDLRTMFSMEAMEYSKFTVIILVMLREKMIGLVVDAVSDVLDIEPSEIRMTPDLGVKVDTRFISGMANVGGRMTVLLDIERLLGDDEVAGLGAGEEENSK
jgi:purine-binding chemotaxis protein CheW